MFVKDKMLIKYALKIRPSLYNHRYISIYGAVNSHHGSKDYYKVLDIKKNSSRKDIKLAYYKLSKKYHPDVSEITESEEKYKDIQEAYHVLGDERRKADYDEAINNGYYSGPSSASSVSRDSPYRAAWKKRTGPIYSGQTKYYDFDQHFREHYGNSKTAKRTPGSSTAGFGSASSSSMNDDELKNYWKTKEHLENFGESDFTATRNRILLRSSFALLGTVILYYTMKNMKGREDELRYQSYLKNINDGKRT